MKGRILVLSIGLMLVLGLSLPVSADWVPDGTSDTAAGVTEYDIEQAMVEFYPDGPGLEEYVNICVDMTDSMPGMLLVEFDVDPAAGSPVSTASLFKSCTDTGWQATNVSGFDININIFLRDQDKDAATAYCSGCDGPPPGATCMYRDTPCTTGGCIERNCWTSGDTCRYSSDDCYIRGEACTTDGVNPCKEGDE